ncbi:leucine-rich repeat-containing protein 15-like [Sycon ciliatum]|uniref:leucine-rich repeat-containing protein 15-like n=1 Tax=Sycon ciliatum TaxID=27933 RepID=UPI0031F65E1A
MVGDSQGLDQRRDSSLVDVPWSIMDNPLKESRFLVIRMLVLLLILAVCTTAQQCPARCSCSATTAWCYLKGLTTAPTGYPLTTQYVNLRRNSITSLNGNEFDGLRSLTNLNLGSNDLSTLPVGIFKDLVSLKELYIHVNRITSLPAGVFKPLASLRLTWIWANRITSLPRNIFDGLSNLEFLHLGHNYLASLPVGIFNGLSSLEDLILFDNKFTSLPIGIFDNLTNIVAMRLDNNQLTLSEDLCSFAFVLPLSTKELTGYSTVDQNVFTYVNNNLIQVNFTATQITNTSVSVNVSLSNSSGISKWCVDYTRTHLAGVSSPGARNTTCTSNINGILDITDMGTDATYSLAAYGLVPGGSIKYCRSRSSPFKTRELL